jgi:hypothetical protein
VPSTNSDSSQEALVHLYGAAADMPLRDAEVCLTIAESEQLRGNLSLAIEYYKKTLVIMSYPPLRKRILTAMAFAYRSMGDEISARNVSPRPPASPRPSIGKATGGTSSRL